MIKRYSFINKQVEKEGDMMKHLLILILTALIGSSLVTIKGEARTIYVPQGSSIEDSLNVALSGDTLLVGPGTFYEHITWPTIDGITLLSQYGIDSTTIDGSSTGRVLRFNSANITNATKIKGFTIANGYKWYGGGGIRIQNGAAPTIVDNLIRDNECRYYGAGILVEDSNPMIIENIIENNHVTCASPDTTHYGAGIYCYNSSALIENNTIKGNRIEEYGKGAGIALRQSITIVRNNRIEADTSVSLIGGGVYLYSSTDTIIGNVVTENMGNGVNATNSDLCIIKDNRIEFNIGKMGGGIYLSGSDADISGNSIIANIADDNGGGKGGGVYILSCSPIIEDNVISRNIAEAGLSGDGSGGGIFANSATDVVITRNTIVLNHAEGVSSMGGAIRLNLSSAAVGTTFAYRNNIYHNFATDGSNIRIGLFSSCNATHNYWGTSDSTKISATIVYADWYPFEYLPLTVEKVVSDTGFYTFGEVEINFSSLTRGRDSIVQATIYADSVSTHCAGTRCIAKFFDLQGSLTFDGCFRFYYTDSEFTASTISSEDSIDAYRHNGVLWLVYPGTVDTAENTVTVTSSEFSEWMLAEDASGLGIEEREHAEIMDHRLVVYPNPFWEKMEVKIHTGNGDRIPEILLYIYDLSGRLVGKPEKYIWDGRDMNGNEIKSGIYFLRAKGYKPVKLIKLKQ